MILGRALLVCTIVLAMFPLAQAAPLFDDGFESGNLARIQNGHTWGVADGSDAVPGVGGNGFFTRTSGTWSGNWSGIPIYLQSSAGNVQGGDVNRMGPYTVTGNNASTLFFDGDASGAVQKQTRRAFVSATNPYSGNYSVKFIFGPDPLGQDSRSQLPIQFGQGLAELWVEYMLYIPSNYFHRNDVPTNNKFALILGRSGGDSSRMLYDFETMSNADGSSRVFAQSVLSTATAGDAQQMYSNTGHPGTDFVAGNGPARPGSWNRIQVHVKPESGSGAADGMIELWVNNTLVFQLTDARLGYPDVPGSAWYGTYPAVVTDGYILGAANSGYGALTEFFVDDFKLYDADPGWNTPPETGICEAIGSGKCYYINPVNGNDANNGSFAAPWKSFRNIVTWYQASYRPAGWKQLGAGDAIYLFNGTVNTSIIPGGWNNSCSCAQPDLGSRSIAYFNSVSGTQTTPIRLKNYPGHSPAIGDIMSEPYTDGLSLAFSRWWEISGIEFKEIPGDCVSLGDGSNDVRIWNVSVHDCARKDAPGNPAGIKLTSVYRTTIANSTFYDTFWDPFLATPSAGSWFLRGAGVQIFRGGNFTVYGNDFFQTKQGRDPNGNLVGYANCIFQKHAQTDVDGFLHVYNNTFRNCSGMGKSWAFGSGTQNTHFHHNLLIDSEKTPIHVEDFGGITYLANQLYEYNTIVNGKAFTMGPTTTQYEGLFPVLPWNITYRNNIVVDTTATYTIDDNFIDIGTYMDDTTYTAAVTALRFENNCYYNPSTALRFNIGRANGGAYGVLGALSTFAQWQALGYDTNSVVADPQFVNAAAGNFRLQQGSPCSVMGAYATGDVAPPPPPPATRVGDLNGDGVVNVSDVILIIQNFKRRMNYDTGADINGDGTVNIYDMVLLGRNWG